jgi:hypothetical protein
MNRFAFVSVNTDFSSDEWRKVADLAGDALRISGFQTIK